MDNAKKDLFQTIYNIIFIVFDSCAALALISLLWNLAFSLLWNSWQNNVSAMYNNRVFLFVYLGVTCFSLIWLLLRRAAKISSSKQVPDLKTLEQLLKIAALSNNGPHADGLTAPTSPSSPK